MIKPYLTDNGSAMEPIAILGMGCRLPEADTPREYWRRLCANYNAVKDIPEDRWDKSGLFDPSSARKGKIKSWKGSFIENVRHFDWRSLKLLPKEARYMDPQHRLLLELAWESLEDAGLLFDEIAGSSTGVFIGIQWADYLRALIKKPSELNMYAAIGNCLMFAANRISYFFDFKGPSLVLNSGCASSLVALKQACQSLWTGETDMALAGAAELMISPEVSIMMSESGMISNSGRCLPLDSEADGFVRGEGGGMIVLKPLSKLNSNDRPYAYIRGVSLRHNGRNEWIMASSKEAQTESIREACEMAGASPENIDFVELHGTGNPKGDPVEIQSIAETICRNREDKPCLISSVKSNIGYLGPASGIASVIKTALSIHKKKIPPSHIPEKYNELILMDQWNLRVPEKLTNWPITPEGALACVTSLSMGGAVAHAILSQTDDDLDVEEENIAPLLLPVSVSNKKMLIPHAEKFHRFLKEEQKEGRTKISDICYTAALRRKHEKYRMAAIGRNYDDFIEAFQKLIGSCAETSDIPLVAVREDIEADDLRKIAVEYATNELSDLKGMGLYASSAKVSSLPTYCWNREYLWPKWLDAEALGSPDESSEALPAGSCGSGGLKKETLDMQSLLQASEEKRENLIETALRNMVSECLGIDFAESSVERASFIDLGFNSLSAAELKNRLELDFQLVVPISFILGDSSIADLAAKVAEHFADNERPLNNAAGETKSDYDAEEYFPLTDIQQAYWIGRADAAAFGGVGCHYYQEFESVGLNIERLESSFRKLILKHDMLRAVVTEKGKQTILEKPPEFKFRKENLENIARTEVDSKIGLIRKDMSHRVYSPEKWPLFSVCVSNLGKGRIRLHLSIDLLIADAQSLSLLIEDWGKAYRESREFNVELKYSFKDYVFSEINKKREDAFSNSLEYWRQKAASMPPAPRLPLISEHNSDENLLKRARRTGRLDKGRWECLIAKAKSLGLRPTSVLCMAFSETLRAWSGNDRFTLNLTYCARTPYHPQVGDLLGDFTSVILLEVDCAPKTFEERARKLQAGLTEDMDHAIVSGVEVARLLRNRGESSEDVIMPIVFTSLLGGRDSLPSPFSSCWLGNSVYGASQTPQVIIDHQAYEENGSLVYNWDAIDGLFPSGLIDAMFSAYNDLLLKLSEEDFCWLDEQLLLTPRNQLDSRLKLNSTVQNLEPEFLHGLFEKRSAETPQKTAILSSDKTFSYSQLDSLSRRIASELQGIGVERNELVGVVMLKGWEQVAAALGILKAGAAYLPVEADLPIARINKIIESGKSKIVLTQSAIENKNLFPKNMKVMSVDRLSPDKDDFSRETPAAEVTDLAYTIFTSGSTGAPKGVMINHSGAVNTILDVNSRFKVSPRDKILALSSLSFDLSVYDIFGALAAGAEIVIPEHERLRDPGHWIELINDEQVTIWNSAPALMGMLTDYFSENRHNALESLRLILLSGDWIPLNLPGKIRKIAPYAEIISLGGATEASIWSIIHPVEERNFDGNSIPYGKPMKNQSFHVLDNRLLPTPDHVEGELFIGGDGLAMGYWENQSETDYRFISHPLTGERVYRTGDLGRYTEDGNIEILGRVDFQVKIRGHRIELGEIEATLIEHDKVKDAVLIARKNPRTSLAAYIAPHDDNISEDDVKLYLEQRLPGYMIPGEIFFIEKLPVTANGKIDRAELLEIKKPKTEDKAPKVLSETEKILADIICEELKLNGIDAEDNLFSLGASSIELVPIHKKVVSRLKIEVSIAELFNHATIRSLAKRLERLRLGKRLKAEKTQDARKANVRHKRAASRNKRKRNLEKLL